MVVSSEASSVTSALPGSLPHNGSPCSCLRCSSVAVRCLAWCSASRCSGIGFPEGREFNRGSGAQLGSRANVPSQASNSGWIGSSRKSTYMRKKPLAWTGEGQVLAVIFFQSLTGNWRGYAQPGRPDPRSGRALSRAFWSCCPIVSGIHHGTKVKKDRPASTGLNSAGRSDRKKSVVTRPEVQRRFLGSRLSFWLRALGKSGSSPSRCTMILISGVRSTVRRT